MPLEVELKQVDIAFDLPHQRLCVVEDIDFGIEQGEILALLGESGCGKSVIAQAVMRLLPPYARYGEKSAISLCETELLALPEKLMRALRGKRIGMVFQEPMTALNPVLTIYEQLAEVFLLHRQMDVRDLKQQLLYALEEVELPEPEVKLHQYPHQLSGGQKQRVVIAMALANHPELLIADEPTTALDVTIQAQILALIKRLQQQRKMSVLFITHDLDVVKMVANRVCVMYAGEMVQLASREDFFKEIRHPYVQQLLASSPQFEKRNHVLSTIPGVVPGLNEMPQGCRFHPRCAHAFSRCERDKPALLPWKQGSIRCHLYEQGDALPELKAKVTRTSGETSKTNHDICLSGEALCIDFTVKTGRWQSKEQVIHAVDKVSFALRQGQTLAVVGESGSGKTTLSRALLGLYPLNEGEVYFNGQKMSHFNKKQWRNYRKSVQMVFQDPFTSLDPRMTVAEILAEGMQAHGMGKKQIHKKQRELLEQVYLPLYALNKYPHEFSGGQRQRISIARALSTSPQILICDEPTSALDVSIQAQILNLFKELQQAHGLSYLFITHNMNVVAYLADEVMVMKSGEVVESGKTEAVLFQPQHPYTKQLLGAMV